MQVLALVPIDVIEPDGQAKDDNQGEKRSRNTVGPEPEGGKLAGCPRSAAVRRNRSGNQCPSERKNLLAAQCPYRRMWACLYRPVHRRSWWYRLRGRLP